MYYSRIFLVMLLLLSIIILSHSVYASEGITSSPLKQIDNGITSQNITCSNGFELIYKSSNEYPICVKPQTGEKLIQRGWGISQPVNYLVKVAGFLIPYNITGGNMLGVKSDIQSKLLVFSIHTTSDGVLKATLPRALIDAKLFNGTDDQFVILANGKETAFTETKTATDRTLSIPFQSGIEEIEVISSTSGI